MQPDWFSKHLPLFHLVYNASVARRPLLIFPTSYLFPFPVFHSLAIPDFQFLQCGLWAFAHAVSSAYHILPPHPHFSKILPNLQASILMFLM